MVDTQTLAPKVDAVVTLLKRIESEFAPAAFATSLGAEDMVLLDLIAKHAPKIEVFTLDTGRLPPETYDLLGKIGERYRLKLKVFLPDAAAVEQYVKLNGINGFYDSIAQRKACCEVRKIGPLRRALAGKRAWLTGLRREQSPTRAEVAIEEEDKSFGLAKFNPLLEWTHFEIWSYLHRHEVPYNALHDRGYPSIGCAPCTRAIKPGEHARAGRWWWEDAANKECGLHVAAAPVTIVGKAHRESAHACGLHVARPSQLEVRIDAAAKLSTEDIEALKREAVA
jgi:phosphoadenosine phosphosulfate reductase